ncbi:MULTISPECIES: fimbrial protein [Enterobacter]|uniref:fimbrial protein n=1 Tax=Enterobacter TaxID=547 RepID=UPI001C8DC493|nr:fimbrial protein [Enterobacter sp. NIC22-4]MBY0633005.1 type 1 fimbrial protein [Enterobacter sp. NIC22-4]
MKSLMMLFLYASGMTAACAAGGTVNIGGVIENSSCTVAPDSVDQQVALGDISARQFTQVGQVSLPVAFGINLQKCGSATTGVTVNFSGTTDKTDSALLAVDSAAAAASGIAIAIQDDKHTALPLNSASRVYALNPAQENNHLTFYAQYQSTQPQITAGAANATATFTLTYQ